MGGTGNAEAEVSGAMRHDPMPGGAVKTHSAGALSGR